ncbi:DUF6344 domain-containing protein [Streptomyces sp. NPDC001070]
MAANAHVKSFWDVFVTLLFKMVAYLGFAVPESRSTVPAAPRPETVPGTLYLPTAEAVRLCVPAPAPEPAPRPLALCAAVSGPGLRVEPGERTPEVPSYRREPVGPVRSAESESEPVECAESVESVESVPFVPLPRFTGPSSALSLPPTMKQRIRAEAHGASPVARVRTRPIGDAGLDPVLTDATEAPARTPRREWALCA